MPMPPAFASLDMAAAADAAYAAFRRYFAAMLLAADDCFSYALLLIFAALKIIFAIFHFRC